MKIAIDGPAGAGKSTIARKLAIELGIVYVDTGAMYRALTWEALNQGINIDDSTALQNLATSIDIHFENQHIYCNNRNITSEIRLPHVTEAVSRVASHPAVREIMVNKQQQMARTTDIVMDGRDIGECVLPDADFKFFITASIEERARRRLKELQDKGIPCEMESLKAEIANRDNSDMQRKTGALKILDDSIVIDTSQMTIEEVLAHIHSLIQEDKNAL
jgi:cytidylate kinase